MNNESSNRYQVSSNKRQSSKILIVDDEPVVIESILKDLEMEGYKVLSAMNGINGLDIMEKEHPLLIILDLKMPGMDGIEFLERIRLKNYPVYSVIVLTGHGDDEAIIKCFSFGVSSFLKKPYNPYELNGLVRHSVELRKGELELNRERVHFKELAHEREIEVEKLPSA